MPVSRGDARSFSATECARHHSSASTRVNILIGSGLQALVAHHNPRHPIGFSHTSAATAHTCGMTGNGNVAFRVNAVSEAQLQVEVVGQQTLNCIYWDHANV